MVNSAPHFHSDRSRQPFARQAPTGSPPTKNEILFDKLELSGGKKTSTGSWSTNAEVLENLANDGHDFPKLLLEWRALSKLKTTYSYLVYFLF